MNSPLSKTFHLLELLEQSTSDSQQDSWAIYGKMTALAREIVQEVRSSGVSLPILPEDLQALRDFVSWDDPEGMQGSDVEGAILDLLELLVVPKLLSAGSSVFVRWVDTHGIMLPLQERGEAAPRPEDQGKMGMVQLTSIEVGSGSLPWAVCYSVVFSNPAGGQFMRDLYDFEV